MSRLGTTGKTSHEHIHNNIEHGADTYDSYELS
jgi:hypothetical protein